MKQQTGFTLIEIIVVVAIIAILATIAYPAYNNYLMKSHRTDAQMELVTRAQQMERCFTQYGAYNDAACDVYPLTSEQGFYSISLSATPTTFTLTATPQAGQADDVCTELTLDNTNTRGFTGPSRDACWGG